MHPSNNHPAHPPTTITTGETVFVTTKASHVHSPATLPTFAKCADKIILQHSAQTQHLLSSDPDNEWPSNPLPVHITTPSQPPLFTLGRLRKGCIDFRLPFGLRSSPCIFTRFTDALCWILQNVDHLPYTIHYANDYFYSTFVCLSVRMRHFFSETVNPLA